MKIVENCSSNVWTDYNEHDPGLTTLEQLCFALTDLSYRAGLKVEDLLADPDGSLSTAAAALRRPLKILTTEPVTAADWRRLLIDRVPHLANAWLTPRPAQGGAQGLYDIRLYAAPHCPGLFEPERDARARHRRREVEERARRLFLRHRGLCEDLGSIAAMRPVRIVVKADVSIDPKLRPDEAMARIVQQLACHLAPEPRRRPLHALLEESVPTDFIFDGPAMANGFIDKAALGDSRRRASACDLRDKIAAVDGVAGVGEVHLWAEGTGVVRGPRPGDGIADEWVEIGPEEYFALDAGLSGLVLPIRLYSHGIERPVDRRRAVERLEALWAEHRRLYRLSQEYRLLFPPPTGKYRDLARYSSVAGLFPAIYGIGPEGLPRAAPPARRGLAKQLRGYLALFDRAMSDFTGRLAGLRYLFSGEPVDPATQERPLAEIVPELAFLLKDEGPDMDGGGYRRPFSVAQQNGLLDFLLGLYGEDPEPIVPIPSSWSAPRAERHLLSVKRELLATIVRAGKARGSAFDYRARRWRRHASGVALRSRLMLGSPPHRDRRGKPRLVIVEHVLLRSRESRCPPPAPEGGYSMRISAIIHLPPGERHDYLYRHRIERMIRANTPAHIALTTHFVCRHEWVRFRRLHRLWRRALREEFGEGVDWLSAEMIQLFAEWSRWEKQ